MDYLLALKENQETLHDEVKAFFEDPGSLKYAVEKGAMIERVEDHDKGHWRIEKRVCTVTDYLEWLPGRVRRDWLGLRSLVRVETETALSNGCERREPRYFQAAWPLMMPPIISNAVASVGALRIAVTGCWMLSSVRIKIVPEVGTAPRTYRP